MRKITTITLQMGAWESKYLVLTELCRVGKMSRAGCYPHSRETVLYNELARVQGQAALKIQEQSSSATDVVTKSATPLVG